MSDWSHRRATIHSPNPNKKRLSCADLIIIVPAISQELQGSVVSVFNDGEQQWGVQRMAEEEGVFA